MLRSSLLLLPVLLGACAADDAVGEAGDLAFPLVEPGSAEEIGLLAFVNDPGTTVEVLDLDVPLDRRAAANIVDWRDGQDDVEGTADDRPFRSVADLDAVPYVGPVALQTLLDYARAEGWVERGAITRDAAILALVNDPATTFQILDVDVALDRRAAQNIVAARDGADGLAGTADDRPFASVAELDAVPYVGPAALDALAVYALANGYGEPGGGGELPPCAIFSEYIESSGNNNKALEIYNCGAAPLALDRLGVCLVRNDDTTCSNRSPVGTGTLASGDVWIMCRTKEGTSLDPHPTLASVCDFEIGGTATFDGDDRLILFEDVDGDGFPGAGEAILDTFGDPATRPAGTPWAETGLRRCNLEPHAPGPFDAAAYFLTAPRSDYTHLGDPPANDCGSAHVADEGDDCLDTDHCAEGLRCYGRPNDGSGTYGKCVDPTPVPGEGERCDRWTECAEGLICAGWTLWGEGDCVPQWMAQRYEQTVDATIHDAPSGGIAPSVVVYGLASVPVDIEVVARIDHPRRTDLRVTLIDPNGAEAVLWDRTTELAEWNRSFVTSGGISRDDQVNGRWSLRVEDLVAGGGEGTLVSWSLFIVSRWD